MSYCRATRTKFMATCGVKAVNQLNEEHLYSPYADFHYCKHCGKRLVEEPDLTEKLPKDRKGNYLCKDCETSATICDDCGEFIHQNNYRYVFTSECEIVCTSCKEKYRTCKRCGEDHKKEEMFFIDGEWVCNFCKEKYYVECECCKKLKSISETKTTDDLHIVCSECWDEYVTTCQECGRTYYYRENGIWSINDVSVCRNCYYELQNGSSVIHNYSFKPRNKKQGRSVKKEYFGFEIEVSGKECYAKKFLKEFGDTEGRQLYIKHDGSVIGFEIVTQPMTRNYFYKTFVPNLEKGMNFLKKKGFKAHNKAGIHIHVSNEAISAHQMKRLIMLLYSKQRKTYKTWLAITQRKDSEMQHWANMNPNAIIGGKRHIINTIDTYEEANRNKKPNLNSSRYMAINCQNEKTVEFRIFNSNIRIERIIKNAQVIFSLLDFTATNLIPTMSNYLKYIEDNKQSYKELYDFLIEKHIYQPKEDKKKLQEVMNVVGVKNVSDLKNIMTQICVEQNLEVDENDEQERNIEQCA